jgi:phosphoribosylformylglycinamidine synthase
MKFTAEIKITLRQGILDVQGKAAETSLHSLGFTALTDVKIGKFITLDVDANDAAEAEKMVADASNKLLANPIIEDFTIALK